jgi:hypothetical protein
MRFITALVGALLVSACASTGPGTPTGPVNAQLVLAPGQSAAVINTDVQVRFDGVTGDSRCPADAFCIQGGDAIVRVQVVPANGASRSYDLHTGSLQPVRHDDLTIALENLTPYPFSNRTIAPDEYRATLRITR